MAHTMNVPVDAVADAMLEKLAPARGYDDDVAIVLYRHPGPVLVIEIDAIPALLSDVRHQLTAWLRSAGVPEMLAADIAAIEAAARTRNIPAVRAATARAASDDRLSDSLAKLLGLTKCVG